MEMVWVSCCPFTRAAYSTDRLVCGSVDSAVNYDQAFAIDLPFSCRQTDQHIASGCGNFSQLRTHGWRSATAEGPHVEWGKLRIAHHHLDFAHGDMQFFRDALAERCPYVLPHLDLAGIDSHYAVFSKMQPGSDFFRERFVRPPGRTRFLECLSILSERRQSKCLRREI